MQTHGYTPPSHGALKLVTFVQSENDTEADLREWFPKM
jgi:hypothetical protein